MTVLETIKIAKFKARTRNQELNSNDLNRLMTFVLNVSSTEIVVEGRSIEISEMQKQEFLKYVDDLLNGKPLQYIVHKQYFMGLEFYVDENVLIPQPDTEVLVEETFKVVDSLENKSIIKVLDLCTGSGAIAIAIKDKFRDRVNVTASDVSLDALKVAKNNCKMLLGRETEINFLHSDMFNKISDKFDIIVSNPPYIKKDVINILPSDVQREPHIALDGGEDGLDFYRIIKKNVQEYLNQNGCLLVEIGYDQKEAVQELFCDSECVKDYAGSDRVIIYKT